MADRLTAPDEDVKAEPKGKYPINTPKDTPNNGIPPNYKNPFDSTDRDSFSVQDKYPLVFSDIDFYLKQNSRLFVGFENLKVDLNTESKSEIARVWHYKRWLTWKYLLSLETHEINVPLGELEKEGERTTVSINSVTYFITKGVYGPHMIVPYDVYKIIMDSQAQTLSSGQQSLLTSLSHKLDPVTGLPKDAERLER